MGEETGSAALDALHARYSDWLAADLFIASDLTDSPRVVAERPTLFLGSRWVFLTLSFRSSCAKARTTLVTGELAHALSSIVDARGRILVLGLRPAVYCLSRYIICCAISLWARSLTIRLSILIGTSWA
ncbi:MAG: hypothetical protein ACR5LD_02815 [Symbiopectobacterium sp.]